MVQATLDESAVADSSGDTKPPYVSYVTVKNVLGGFKDHVPERIDNTLLTNLAGDVRSRFLLALRWFDLIREDGTVTSNLKALVAAHGTDDWANKVKSIIVAKYDPIIGHLNLEVATLGQMQDAFSTKGKTTGSVTDKAIRFLLKAMEDAGMTYSKYLGKRRTTGPRQQRRRRSGQVGQATPLTPPPASDPTHPGMIDFPIHLKGKAAGKITVPNNIDANDVAMITAAITMIKIYANGGESDDA